MNHHTPLSDTEILELLGVTLHGPLPMITMSRVFATLAEVPALRVLKREREVFKPEQRAALEREATRLDAMQHPTPPMSETRVDEVLKTPIPVDREAVETIGGTPMGEHLALKPNGMQADYVVLTDAERAKGFVRPVRDKYIHSKCGIETVMSRKLAETYARDPSFYSGTYCVGCGTHFPVGENGEFIWSGTAIKVGT